MLDFTTEDLITNLDPILLSYSVEATGKELAEAHEFVNEAVCTYLKNAKVSPSYLKRLPLEGVLSFFYKALYYRRNIEGIKWVYPKAFTDQLVGSVFADDPLVEILTSKMIPRRFLIVGMTGVGKERIASFVADSLKRNVESVVKNKDHTTKAFELQNGNVATLNSATSNAQVFEVSLFGSVEGAFTGAINSDGVFKQVGNGGVVILDEITEAEEDTQVKLLRFLENNEYNHVGCGDKISRRVHIIAVTNRRVESLEQGDGMRRDFYYRLARPSISIPSFSNSLNTFNEKQARDAYDHLMTTVIKKMTAGEGEAGQRVTMEQYLIQRLGEELNLPAKMSEGFKGYEWPGNLRECSMFIEQVIMNAKLPIEELIKRHLRTVESFPASDSAIRLPVKIQDKLEECEKRYYEAAWQSVGSKSGVAGELGVTRQTVARKLEKYGIA
nr:sigma 54-interacting transcriptional regulator [uncultured Pseudodesulfovibrio sp.]